MFIAGEVSAFCGSLSKGRCEGGGLQESVACLLTVSCDVM